MKIELLQTAATAAYLRGNCSPWVMTTPCDHAIGSMVRDVWGPAQEILDTITIESILNAG